MGDADDLFLTCFSVSPKRPVHLVATAHPTLEQLRSTSGWCAPVAKVAVSLTLTLTGQGGWWRRADAPPPMAQPLFQLLDKGRNPSTRSSGGHSEPIMFFTSRQI